MGKGGSSTSVEIPAYIEDAAKKNLTRADRISAIGSVPLSYGPTVAAFTPMQQSSFANTANVANSFGLNAPQQGYGFYGGLDAPTTYANGVTAYSAAPIYQNIMDAFGAARPGQKSYIDSFFIDPFSGSYGSNVMPFSDYTTYTNMTDDTTTSTTGGPSSGGSPSTSDPGSSSSVTIDPGYDINPVIIDNTITDAAGNPAPFLGPDVFDPDGNDNFLSNDEYNAAVSTIGDAIGNPNYNPDTDVIYGTSGQDAFINNAAAQEAADTLYNQNQVIYGPATGNNVTSLTTGGANWQDTVGQNNNSSGMSMEDMIDAQADAYQASGTTFDMKDPSTFISSSQAYNEPATITPVIGNNDTGSNSFSQTMANIFTPNDGTSYEDGKLVVDNKNDNDNQGSADSSDDCVIATHAVASGGFTPNMKREAVVWCMHKLHNRWWGEAVRRGYRYLGRQKIEQGKAREHYAEFRRYIDFASGKRRDLRGAITFSLRTAQFFAVGLIKRSA